MREAGGKGFGGGGDGQVISKPQVNLEKVSISALPTTGSRASSYVIPSAANESRIILIVSELPRTDASPLRLIIFSSTADDIVRLRSLLSIGPSTRPRFPLGVLAARVPSPRQRTCVARGFLYGGSSSLELRF